MRSAVFRALSLFPKLIVRVRGFVFRTLVALAGGTCGRGVRIERGFRLRQGFHSGLSLGQDVYFGRNTTVDCVPGARLSIGSNTTFTQGNFISVCEHVEIGDDVLIGEYTSIRDANHDIANVNLPIVAQPMRPKPIIIAPNVWIARGCAILSGVQIGEGAVVAANAVVTKDVAANTVVGGVPASIIKSRIGH